MGKKKGIALIMALFLVTIFSILSASFFSNVINENKLVRRNSDSVKAFWLAEAGVAEAINNMPANASGHLYGDSNYAYSASTINLSGQYYQISSTGTVSRPSSGAITRSVTVVTRTNPVDPAHFQHAIRTTSDLVVKGSVDINGPSEEFASLNFADLFQHSKEDLKSFATHLYTDPAGGIMPIDGITWIDLSPGGEFRASSSGWSGSGILVIAGDAQITGGTFNGIIYVIGRLRMSGNPVINGTILAESSTEIDTALTGNVTLNYSNTFIINALNPLQFVAPVVVSWRES